ncbi:MAG: class I SAM-dependent methyltransferase [Chloroflexi bacterium]|nr:class I SAM-dependent methyltransferase [Chloroflexota bacterium]
MTKVERYYDSAAGSEWLRLERDRVEFAVTLRALDEYLPPAPARVLDIGGGPGRYAIELTRRGYEVTLADISEAELALATAKAAEAGITLAGVRRADARDLREFADATFDAVLLMGPLYHLLDESDRQRAVNETVRVARPGGIVAATNITRYAAIRWWAKHHPMQVIDHPSVYEEQIATGRTQDAVGFTDVYLMHPAELTALFRETRVEHIVTVACEGVVSMIHEKINALEGEAWEHWVDLNYRLGKDPDTHGLAEHLLYIGRKS